MAKLTTQELQMKYGMGTGTPTTTAPALSKATTTTTKRLSTQEMQAKYSLPATAAVPFKPNPEPHNDNDGFIKSVTKDVLGTLLVKPADRVAEVVGRTGLLGQDIKRGYEIMADEGQGRSFMGINVEAQKGLNEGGRKQILGDALKSASFLYTGGVGAPAVSNVVKSTVPNAAKPLFSQPVKEAGKVGAISGGAYGAGDELGNEESTLGSVIKEGAIGTGLGLVGGATVGKAVPAVTGLFDPVQRAANNRKIVDEAIKDIFKGTTGDAAKVADDAFKAQKGLDLLSKEADNIQIIDTNAPLGSGVMKKLDLSQATPNEILSGVSEIGNKIATIARNSAEKATQLGHKINTQTELSMIDNAVSKGEISRGIGERLKLQIRSAGDTPLGVHDWVEGVNSNFFTKSGSLSDTATAKVANNVASSLRSKLDNIVDRKGYAEAYGNNQALKKMLVAIAKKANKGVDFGDLSTDAGVDAAISFLTGNPAYMARTLAIGGLKGLLSSYRNKAQMKLFRKAADLSKDSSLGTKLPSDVVNPPYKPPVLGLPEPQSKPLFATAKGVITPDAQLASDVASVEAGKAKLPKRSPMYQRKVREIQNKLEPYLTPEEMQIIQMGPKPPKRDYGVPTVNTPPNVYVNSQDMQTALRNKIERYLTPEEMEIIEWGPKPKKRIFKGPTIDIDK